MFICISHVSHVCGEESKVYVYIYIYMGPRLGHLEPQELGLSHKPPQYRSMVNNTASWYNGGQFTVFESNPSLVESCFEGLSPGLHAATYGIDMGLKARLAISKHVVRFVYATKLLGALEFFLNRQCWTSANPKTSH